MTRIKDPIKPVVVRVIRGLAISAIFLMGPWAAAQFPVRAPGHFKFQLAETPEPVPETLWQQEMEQIVQAQQNMDSGDLQEIAYWNAAYPSYRWHQIMMEVGRASPGHKNGGRIAILHLAIYDALSEVWEHKQTHSQPAPFRQYTKILKLGRERDYSAFVCEWSAAAGAAHRVIGYYFPESRTRLDSLLQRFKEGRLRTGLQLPSDIETGLGIGREIAGLYIDYARTDRTDLTWQGKVPESDGLWSGDPGPWDPMKGQWKPLTLSRTDQFRPAPPPADWSADMEELRVFNRTHSFSDIAWKWKSEPIWDNLLERKLLEYDLGPLEAAFASALFHTARFDATIAAWDGKYHYWGIRPFQYDPEFQPILVETPNFPGYPAGHTTVAGALATVLSGLFPYDTAQFTQLAEECSESRFEGGVHFRTDNEVGLKVGARVGRHVLRAFLSPQEHPDFHRE